MRTSASSSAMAERSSEDSSARLPDPRHRNRSRSSDASIEIAMARSLGACNRSQSLELLDPAVAGRDRNSEPAAEFQRGHGAFEGPHEDPGGVLVHHGLAQLQRLHHIQSPRSPRIRETRLVISSASKGLFTYPMAPRRTLSISVKLSPKAVMRIARRPGFTRRADSINSTPLGPGIR